MPSAAPISIWDLFQHADFVVKLVMIGLLVAGVRRLLIVLFAEQARQQFRELPLRRPRQFFPCRCLGQRVKEIPRLCLQPVTCSRHQHLLYGWRSDADLLANRRPQLGAKGDVRLGDPPRQRRVAVPIASSSSRRDQTSIVGFPTDERWHRSVPHSERRLRTSRRPGTPLAGQTTGAMGRRLHQLPYCGS